MSLDDFHKTDMYGVTYGADAVMTFTGKMIRPLKMIDDIELVCIEDIAHALGNLCRYTGHTKFFYSVANHSVIVSNLVPQHLALAGLLHDAGEAYFNDLARPIKHLDELKAYRHAEELAKILIWNKFLDTTPVKVSDLDAISLADKQALRTEQRDLMAWHHSYPDDEQDFEIAPWTPELSITNFLQRYNDLVRTQGKKENG